ncbi:MAG TPA: CBS domain-containing protein [Candidatus Atribacteria bacterium]|nr:CBS domain-containing protein [Candidatus Atribacteria bacterium]HPT78999.1 CBS domain-containing protein [Candidatus Atribacteria bacterium]
MKVRDVMTAKVATVAPDKTVLEAARLMQTHNVGAVPVCLQNGNVAGIVTDRDIVVRCIANNGDPKATLVKDIMTQEVITASPDLYVDDAAKIMSRYKIRRLPVVENASLVGMISIGDLATRHLLQDEASEALSEISEPSKPMNMIQ